MCLCVCVSVSAGVVPWVRCKGRPGAVVQGPAVQDRGTGILIYCYTHTPSSPVPPPPAPPLLVAPTSCQVWLDRRLVELPALEGVVVLNINSWSAGCTMWREGDGAGLAASRCGSDWVGETWEWSSDCASSLSL